VQFLADSYHIPWAIATSRGIRGGEGSSVGEDQRRRKDRRFDRSALDFGVIGILVRIRLAWRG